MTFQHEKLAWETSVNKTGHQASSSLASWMLPAGVLLLIIIVIAGVTTFRNTGSPGSLPVPTNPQTPLATTPAVAQFSRPATASAETDQANANTSSGNMEGIQVDSQREVKAKREAYERQYLGELVDKRWAGPVEAKMLSASKSDQISQLNAQPTALDIDCKATMCRIQADFSNQSTAQDWFTLFSLSGSDIPDASYQYSSKPDGSAHLTVYGRMRQ